MSNAVTPPDSQTPSSALLSLLEASKPSSILLCSTEPLEALQHYCQEHQITLHEVHDLQTLQSSPPCDLAIVSNFLEQQDKTKGVQLLASLRNYYSPHIWLLVEPGSPWQFNDFIGLGFKRLQQFSQTDRELESYGYHIANYNRKRSWNNPQHWANPENWGKYWW